MILWEASSSEETRRTSSADCGNVLRSSIWNWPRRKLGCCSLGVLQPSTGASTDQRPETFEFLDFKHVCGEDRAGRFALIRIRCTKSCRKFLSRAREWLLGHRHWKRRQQQQRLTVMLRGFYEYLALHHCDRKLSRIHDEVQRHWVHASAPPRSSTADQLGVFERSNVVRAAVSSRIASGGMKRRSSQKSSGEPSAGHLHLHAGFCLGRRVQEVTLAR